MRTATCGFWKSWALRREQRLADTPRLPWLPGRLLTVCVSRLAVACNPNDPDSRVLLGEVLGLCRPWDGWLWRLFGGPDVQFQQAIELAKRQGDAEAVADAQAEWAFYLNTHHLDVPKAKALFETVLANPQSQAATPDAFARYAELLAGLGERDQALVAVADGLSHHPDDPVLQTARQEIEEGLWDPTESDLAASMAADAEGGAGVVGSR